MSGLLNYSQTSGNAWEIPTAGRLYHHSFQEAEWQEVPRKELGSFIELEDQMACFEAEHEALLNEVRKLYVFPRDISVSSFFRGHRTIPQLLVSALPYLKQHFGADTVFALRISIDENGWQMLYAVAMWPSNVQEAATALDQFEDQWWLPNSRQSFGRLTFTYELI